MSKLGIIGGTFDPPHYAHLAIAEEARVRLDLDQVLFAPAYGNPLKQSKGITTANHRLQMTLLAIADNPHFATTSLDLRPGPSYTVSLLERIKSEQPTADLYFILGLDALEQLASWRQPQRVLELAQLVAFARPGASFDLAALAAHLPTVQQRVLLIADGPMLDISASDLRHRVAAGLPIRYQTPDAVVEYIREHGLYRTKLYPRSKVSGLRPTARPFTNWGSTPRPPLVSSYFSLVEI